MSSNGKKQTKLQLRMYPERNEQHRRALAWLMEHKTVGVSYADLVSKAICSQIDREQRMDAAACPRGDPAQPARCNHKRATVGTAESL